MKKTRRYLKHPVRIIIHGLVGWLILFSPTEPAVASETHYLFRHEIVCSRDEAICIRGTLSFDVNPRLLRLRGRVQNATGSGLLRIRLTGANRLGHRRTTEIELFLRGTHSEIIDHKMIPDYPDIENWEVVSISYETNRDKPTKR